MVEKTMLQTWIITVYVIIFLQLLQSPITTSVQRYKIINLECKANPKFAINVKCRVKAINRDRSVVNLSCDIVDVLENISIHFQIFQKNSLNIYRPFLVNFSDNACDWLNNKKTFIYKTIILNYVKEFSNINHTCPYRGRIFAKNAYIDQRFIPVLPPIGMYKIAERFFDSKSLEEIGTINLYVEVTEKP